MNITTEAVNKALREIVKDYPDCNSNGLNSGALHTERCALKAFIDDKDFLREVKFCYEYIEGIISRKGVCKTITRSRGTSYGLKHVVERYIRDKHENEIAYVCNFSFITAMQLHPKAKFKVIGGHCNPYTNLRYDPCY